MITTYNDFLIENRDIDGITPEELKLLKKYNIENYHFNDVTKKIDIDSNIDWFEKKFNSLPEIRLGNVTGDFLCTNNKLTSLLYCPTRVEGNFICSDNELTNLVHCPKYVGGFFSCAGNQITSLKNSPNTILDDFNCSNNPLSNLKYCPKSIPGDFRCGGTKLTSLDNSPEYVGGSFYCTWIPNINTLENYPMTWIEGEISNTFSDILEIVKRNPESYKPLIESKDKIKFHQQIMRDNPGLIQYYTTIGPPSKRTII